MFSAKVAAIDYHLSCINASTPNRSGRLRRSIEEKAGTMVVRSSTIHGLAIAALCLVASPGIAAPLQDWRFDPETNQLEVTVKAGVKPKYSFLARPARIVLELPNTEVGTVKTQETYRGAVRQITVSEARPGVTQVVLELAPTTVLDRQQLEFRQVVESDQSRDRWILRPLVASAPKPVLNAVKPAADPMAYPPGLNPTETGATSSAPQPAPEVPKAEVLPPTPTPPSISQLPTTVPSNSLPLPEVNPNLAIPESLPPVRGEVPTSAPTVSVPPLTRSVPTPQDIPPLPGAQNFPPASAPPTSQTSSQNSNGLPFPLPDNAGVSSPQIPERFSPPTPVPQVAARPNVIDFGQPLVSQAGQIPAQPYLGSLNSPGQGVLLPTGTVLSLRYSGFEPLKLQSEQPRQEVLLLQNEIRDRAGNVVIPAGSAVFGRFETGGSGSRFVAQGISLRGRSIRLVGQSEALSGARQVTDTRLIRNSGIGALAGALLGGLSGGNVLGGAAVGAGVTYALAPRPATIQPGQIVQIRLTEDLR